MTEKFDTACPKYLISYPDDYVSGRRYPILFLLHGAGTRGDSLERLERNAFFTRSVPFAKNNFIIVAPLCSRHSWFDHFEGLIELYRSVAAADFADPDRVYIIGASMGGYATWQLATSCPEYTAAIVPICGGGMQWTAARLKNIPVWAHHGELDDVVSVDESRRMVDAVNRAGGNARLTVYPDVAHASWINAYSNEEVFRWLLEQKRYVEKLDGSFDDIDRFG